MQNTRLATASPVTLPIVAGHFVEGGTYATWRPHGTQDYLLIVTVAGCGRVGWNGGERRLVSGEAVLLRPGTLHDYGTAPVRGIGAAPIGQVPAWEILWAHFLPRPHWLPLLDWPQIAPGIGLLTLGDKQELFTSFLHDTLRRTQTGHPRRDDHAMHALEAALLTADDAHPHTEAGRMDNRVLCATESLTQNLREPMDFVRVAREVGLSPSRLAHLFREHTGLTPQGWVERERMTRAKQLLTLTPRTITAIAEEVGYENPFYFTLRFKKHTGVSPTEWRRGVER